MDLRDARKERLADLTREAEEELPKAPDDALQRLPGGWARDFSSQAPLYRPPSLPHTRYHSAAPQYVVKVWVIAGFGLAAILVMYGFYLVAR